VFQAWKARISCSAGLILTILAVSACTQTAGWANQNHATLAAMNLVDSGSVCTAAGPAPTSSSFIVLVGAGLLTGLSHCVGMCGPLVGAFAMRRRTAGQEISTPLVLFQMGRLTTYVLLGALVGGAGYVLASAIRDWQGLLSVGLGLLMALLGLSLLGLLPLQRWISALAPTRVVSGYMKQLLTSNHAAAPFGLGLANGLLPCGPVYAMALLAAMSGDPLRGASVMLIFGLGTLPTMLGLGFSTSLLSLGLRSNLYRAAALLVVLVGLQLAMRGLAVSGQISHAAIGGVMLW